jgi:hypothetical protein
MHQTLCARRTASDHHTDVAYGNITKPMKKKLQTPNLTPSESVPNSKAI